MKNSYALLAFVAILTVLFTACRGEETPALAVENQPTLVYIYTEA